MKDFSVKEKVDSLWPELTEENREKYFDNINIQIDVKN